MSNKRSYLKIFLILVYQVISSSITSFSSVQVIIITRCTLLEIQTCNYQHPHTIVIGHYVHSGSSYHLPYITTSNTLLPIYYCQFPNANKPLPAQYYQHTTTNIPPTYCNSLTPSTQEAKHIYLTFSLLKTNIATTPKLPVSGCPTDTTVK